jgi:hypothetical protein
MTGQMPFLGMVLTAILTFMGTLGAVSVWSRIGRSGQPGA